MNTDDTAPPVPQDGRDMSESAEQNELSLSEEARRLQQRARAAELARKTAESDFADALARRAAADLAWLKEVRARERNELWHASIAEERAQSAAEASRLAHMLAEAEAAQAVEEKAAVAAAKQRIRSANMLARAARARAKAHLKAANASRRRSAAEAEESAMHSAKARADLALADAAKERMTIEKAVLDRLNEQLVSEEQRIEELRRSRNASRTVHHYDSSNRYTGKIVTQGNAAFRYDAMNQFVGREVTVGGTTRYYDALNNAISKSARDQ